VQDIEAGEKKKVKAVLPQVRVILPRSGLKPEIKAISFKNVRFLVPDPSNDSILNGTDFLISAGQSSCVCPDHREESKVDGLYDGALL
jgi:hypothetical protein